MSLIRLNHISYCVDGQVDDLLNDISFDINKQDRVGLIGPNGCDKPTLLRMILGEVTPASGEIVRSDMVDTAGYLRQYTPPSSQLSVLEAALVGMPEIADLYTRRKRLEATMEDPHYEAFDEAVNEYGNTLDAYHRAGGYESEQVAGEILMGLGFDGDDREQPLTQLSSGQRTRVELARLLVQPTDFLMLDEPTNHLDIEGQNWLEDYLNRYDGTVLIVAHDRHFLDRTVARILELRRGQLRLYTGNYINYAAARKQEEESAWAQYERAGKEVHRLRGTVGERKRMARKVQGNKATAGASADFYARKASKVMKRAKAIGRKVEQQLEQQKTAKPFVEKQTILGFPPMEESGAVVINAIGISKGFDDHPLFSDTTFSVGSVDETWARMVRGALLLRRDKVHDQINVLSIGERGRVALAKLLLSGVNLLVLDEPTNHLDIDARVALEQALENYPGTIIFISHDRRLIEYLADTILMIKEGQIRYYSGKYMEEMWSRYDA